uniref:T-complex 11 family, X-linked 2 n=1 Tax=Lepisosteus oculatus TaxID=7918 RepID=W5MV71_LEPOC|nr:PREDICTED: T-complex protein 11 homolog [Lepisosteus oculatus]XP_015197646.1 PREDICTED: T-complex protein 11 homolog [Lepisosteus oculatus]XP_015197647.1 PREDICTED: T-complex protein 11 homolog [Lepisosteus oculatus]XP_015197648.1 PREDICTED: T-complex protein 11 homolog [Lepisosteus oculatus]
MPNITEKPAESEELPSDTPDLATPDPPCASPPRPAPLEEVMEIERNVSNLSIAHEIVVNRDFCFRQSCPPPDSLEGRVKEMMHKAFWDSLQAQLSLNPPDYTQAIRLLQEVKEALLSLLLPGHTRLRAQVGEALDLALIRQQAEHGALDLQRLGGFVIATMAALCAPARDGEIRRLRELSEPVPLLREILRVLGLMKMDAVNFTVQALRPHLLQQAVQYERAKFQEILDKRSDALDNTTAWLQRAVKEVSTACVPPDSGAPSPGQTPAPREEGSPCSPSAVLNQAYLHLLCWDPECPLYPETVLMDRSRLDGLQRQVDQLTVMAAVLLVTSSQCGGAVCSGPGFVDKLKEVMAALLEGSHSRSFNLQEALLGVGEQVQRLVNQGLRAQGGPAMDRDQEAVLRGQIRDIAKTDNPVRTLLASRIQSFLRTFLGSPAGQRGPMVPPAGLASVGAELTEIGAAFGRITHHNRLVFGPFYSAILKKALFPEGECDTGIDSR